jgi:hypothetical protein
MQACLPAKLIFGEKAILLMDMAAAPRSVILIAGSPWEKDRV